MNDAILKFRRYEDASLSYTGVNRHAADTRIGLMDSTVPIEALVNMETYPRKFNFSYLLSRVSISRREKVAFQSTGLMRREWLFGRIMAPHCGLRPCAGLPRWHPCRDASHSGHN